MASSTNRADSSDGDSSDNDLHYVRRLSSPGEVADTPTPVTFRLCVLTFLSAVGGFLFGYDTGVVSGAMLLIRTDFHLTDVWHEAIVAATVFSAFVFALVGGEMSSRWGRRPAMLAASVAFTVAGFFMGMAANKYMLLVGRLIAGIGVGISSMAGPVYIAEAAPAALRGRMTIIYQLMITAGQLFASIVAGVLSYAAEGWRYMLGISAIPAIAQFFGLVAMPESPRFLVQKGKYSEATEVLKKIRNPQDPISEEVEELKISTNRTTCAEEVTYRQIWKNKNVRKAAILGCGLQMFQQLCGINTVMYYSASIVRMAGFSNTSHSIWLSTITAAVNFGCTFIGIHFVDKKGRRPLLLASLSGVAFSLVFLSFSFGLMNSQDIASSNFNVSSGNRCDQHPSCLSCLLQSEGHCGFCLDESDYTGQCRFPIPGANTSMTCKAVGKSSSDNMRWLLNTSCPNWFKYLPVLGICLYVFCFSPGMGPLPWTINAEIYPLWARAKCTGLATSVNWMSNLFVAMTFLTIVNLLGGSGAFLFYAVLSLIGLAYFAACLPETRGCSLEETECLFAGPRSPDRAKEVPYSRITGNVFED